MRRVITILTFALLGTIVAQGQIKIGGNVYGGGNQGVVNGSTKVTVKSGDIGAILDDEASRPLEDPKGKVFGGARMADVGGNTFVHIDGKSDPAAANTNYILINQVFGGNDIAGNIGTAAAVEEDILCGVGVSNISHYIRHRSPSFHIVGVSVIFITRIVVKVIMNHGIKMIVGQMSITAIFITNIILRRNPKIRKLTSRHILHLFSAE